MKYLQPIYQALLDSDKKDLALKWYHENINFYHPYCVKKVGDMLGVTEEQIAIMKFKKTEEMNGEQKFLSS
jgi:hypothetical protein